MCGFNDCEIILTLTLMASSYEANAHPLKVNDVTGELSLPVRNHPDLVLTPQRPTDAARLVELLNDDGIRTF